MAADPVERRSGRFEEGRDREEHSGRVSGEHRHAERHHGDGEPDPGDAYPTFSIAT